MWNGTSFCDGPCQEVGGASKLMSQIFTMCFGMVPAANFASNWQVVADWGLEGIGDYGSFWFIQALTGGYYSDATGHGASRYAPDDVIYHTLTKCDNAVYHALYHALTKCDNDSWCSGLRGAI